MLGLRNSILRYFMITFMVYTQVYLCSAYSVNVFLWRSNSWTISLFCKLLWYTVNGERFAGLNFHGFQEHCECFLVNIIQALYNGIA